MTRKRHTKDDEVSKAEWKGFYSFSLLQPDKDAIKQELENWTDGTGLGIIENLAGQGYKVAVTYEPNRGCIAVSAYGQYADNPNAGRMVCIRHRDFNTAIAGLYHVIATVFDYGRWDDANESKDWYSW